MSNNAKGCLGWIVVAAICVTVLGVSATVAILTII